MMRVTLIYVGATSEKYLAEACAEYEKRLSAFVSFKSVCVKEERIGDEASEAAVGKALAAEEQRIRAAVPKGAYTVAMCVEGRRATSEELAERLASLPSAGVSSAAFIIGSSHGLAPALKADCSLLLSMSDLTFPHMLARVMLTEQLYRAYTIIHGKKYHK